MVFYEPLLRVEGKPFDRICLTLFRKFCWIFEQIPKTSNRKCVPLRRTVLDRRWVHGFLAHWYDRHQLPKPIMFCYQVVITTIYDYVISISYYVMGEDLRWFQFWNINLSFLRLWFRNLLDHLIVHQWLTKVLFQHQDKTMEIVDK